MVREKKETTRKTLVLLDAHAIIHRAYHALPDFSTRKGEPTGGLYGVAAMLIKIINELKPDYIAACYDMAGPTFRHEAYEEYKAGRPKAEEALVRQIVRSRDIFEAFGIPIYEKEGFEADDILGTVAKELKGEPVDIIIASGDMDTLQLVDGKRVRVYTLRKGLSDTVTYDEKSVETRFGFSPKLLPDFKGLRGDPSDNIVGVQGIGEKTATMLIKEFGSVEALYKKLKKGKESFKKAGLTDRVIDILEKGEEEALFSKTLATIRTDAPIKFEIPKKTWREHFEIKNIEKLFAELEFRSLLVRVKDLWGGGTEEEETQEEVPPDELKKTAIALWIVRSDITSPGLEDILQYAGTASFREAREKIFADLKNEGLEQVYKDIEEPLIPIVERAETRGVLVDVPYLKKLSTRVHKELNAIESSIYAHAGETFNINSPKQLAEMLFDKMGLAAKGLKKTAGGARSTRESELVKLRGEHKIIDEILRYRELQKLLSTYIDNIPGMVGEDNRLHTSLHQAGTTTGRFSSTNPNLQNIPASEGLGTEVRNAFIAPKGYSLVSFDYSQIEMRILAVLSKDEILMKIFNGGEDVHASVAARVFGVREDEVTKDMRRQAKVINFGIIYGMGVNALRENLGSSRAEAQQFYDNYFIKFPRVAKYFENVKATAHKNGFTETLFGRRRFFEGIASTIPYIRAMAERMAMNAPLQGTAADVIKIAMYKCDDVLKKEKLADEAYLILQVHDELIFEVKDELVPRVKELVRDTMEHAVKLPVVITVNVSSGKRWGDLK